MIQLDPIIAVNDVEASSKWYEQVFEFSRKHEGENFAVLLSKEHEIQLCLHKWGEHQHPTMNIRSVTPGNGLILYFRTDDIHKVRNNFHIAGGIVEEEIHLNLNSLQQEFSIKDPDGYYLTVSEFHEY